MNILLTNDDGYNFKGILLLKEKLKKYGRVIIAAPLNQMSATSVAITFYKGLKVQKVEEDVYACDGTPADCVCFGLVALNIPFDLVVSGCNNGLNASYDTIYSGTVGAALEALTHRVPAIAFSCNLNFEIVEKYFDEVYDFIVKNDLLSLEYILNVNFPIGEVVKDIRISTLYYSKHQSYFVKENDGYYVRRISQTDYSDDPNSDCYLISNGIVSITPLSKTCFSKETYQSLKSKIDKNNS